VVSFVAAKEIKNAQIHNWSILVTEGNDNVMTVLQENVLEAQKNGYNIEAKKAILGYNGENGVLTLEDGFSLKNNGYDLIIADIPFVDFRDTDSRFYDWEHRLHKALFDVVNKPNYLKETGRLITAFSSLGGGDDIAKFERTLVEKNLIFTHKEIFIESNYQWMVYSIARQEKISSDFWWMELKAKDINDQQSIH
jgi:hypothetical protein